METTTICNYNTDNLQSRDCRKEEFNLLEVSILGKRHNIAMQPEIDDLLRTNNPDVLRSVYYYTKDIESHKKAHNGEINGYYGVVYAPYFLMRTSPTLPIAEASKTVRDFVGHLNALYEVDGKELTYFFDGINSFYILFRHELLGIYEIRDDLPAIHSHIDLSLSEGRFFSKFDHSVSSKAHLMPVLNTYRTQTGKFSVELSYDEIMNLGNKDIISLSKTPRRETNLHVSSDQLMEVKGLSDLKAGAQRKIRELISYMQVPFGGINGLINVRPLGGSLTGNYQSLIPDIRTAVLYGLEFNGFSNIYFGLAARKDSSTGKKSNCHALHVLYADIDFGAEGHAQPAHYKTKEEVLELIGTLKLKPSVVQMSGHGFQLLWRLNKPIEITEENLFKTEEMIRRLNVMLHGDPVQNLDRIFRMPLTLNVKTDRAVEAKIVDINELEYSLEEFEDWVGHDYEVQIKRPPKESKVYEIRESSVNEQSHLLDIQKWENVKISCKWVQDVYDKVMKVKHLTHDERKYTAFLLKKFQGGDEEITNLISQCTDYDEDYTNYQIKQIVQGSYLPPLCSTLCPSSSCDAITRIGKKSPIAFAYRDIDEEDGGAEFCEPPCFDVESEIDASENCSPGISQTESQAVAKSDNKNEATDGDKKPGDAAEVAPMDGMFWKVKKIKSKKGSSQLEKIEVEIDKVGYIRFLCESGFAKFEVNKDFIFIQITNNRVKEVSVEVIMDYVLTYVRGLDIADKFKAAIEEKLLDRVSYFFSEKLISAVESRDVKFRRDKKSEAYFYFDNYFVTVCKGKKIETKGYDQLDGLIWESQVIKRDFRPTDEKSDFDLFTFNCMGKDVMRHRALKSAIGYMIHTYKDSSNSRAVVLCDERISENPNGRTGKSLVGKAISKMVNSLRIDGKNFEFTKGFRFQQVELSTNVVDFNDVRRDFEFERLFSVITDSMTIEKKQIKEFTIPFETSPKILISTNFTIKGRGDSYKARLYEIEFSDCYSAYHQPTDDFTMRFFDDWNDEAWNRFYNFMLGCVGLFLEEGLVKSTTINIEKRKLLEETNSAFVSFAENSIRPDEEYTKSVMLSQYKMMNDTDSDITSNRFTSYLKIYADYLGLDYKQRDSSGAQKFKLETRLK